ncbi:hypothetical protein [Pseudomonas cremoricolorata]|uniref:hypothetical protein n=1 Tax=Pseudomonas cremoricolorata TaxID=157783 RepID=UPI0012B6663C|nr:hypothetical protein [Pseudomonas cremoricolorata]
MAVTQPNTAVSNRAKAKSAASGQTRAKSGNSATRRNKEKALSDKQNVAKRTGMAELTAEQLWIRLETKGFGLGSHFDLQKLTQNDSATKHGASGRWVRE